MCCRKAVTYALEGTFQRHRFREADTLLVLLSSSRFTLSQPANGGGFASTAPCYALPAGSLPWCGSIFNVLS